MLAAFRPRVPACAIPADLFLSSKGYAMETQVPFSHLVMGRDNVRRTNTLVDIPVLAALIKSQGLLQNLLVRENGDGKYRVIDGRRRRSAIKLLLDSGDWPKGQLVPVKVLTAEHNDTEVGLAANISRIDMHPADTFEGFRRRVQDEGETPEAIAARFGYTVSTVRGFLKLANVSPRLMRDFKKDEVTLEQMKALAITDDHKRQEAVFYDTPEHLRQPRTLKRLLMEGRLGANDRLVRFVGIEPYEAAGGAVTRDLFGPDGDLYIEDSGLMRKLATARLDEEAATLRHQGWKWVEVRPDATAADLREYRRVARPDHGFDPTSRTAKMYAGAVVGIDGEGGLCVTSGLLKPEDAKALARARVHGTSPAPEPSSIEGVQYPAPVIEELTALRTVALRAEIAKRPDVALAIIVHDVLVHAFYDLWDGQPLTEIMPKVSDVASHMRDAETNVAVMEVAAATKTMTALLPEKACDLWPWLLARDRGLLLELLALGVAGSVNAVRYRHEKSTPARVSAGDRLARTLDLDMRKWWQADASLLSRMSKVAMLAALREAGLPDDARSLDHASKGELVTAVERKLAGSGWLPAALQTSADTTPQPVEQKVEELGEEVA
jgi:ParB family chromosome partitioning protein